MASIPNLVVVPVVIGVSGLTTNAINQMATPRTPTPFPQNLMGGGNNDPIGPQRWPTKL